MTQRHVFLYGNIADNFEANSALFIEAAGGQSAKIALLLQGGPDWETYGPRYRDPWMRLGAAEVAPIVPVQGTTELDTDALVQLRDCSGIFMGGGDTRKYRQVYVLSEAGDIIRERYRAGVPYGGVSAGALVTPDVGTVWGSQVTTSTNEYTVSGPSFTSTPTTMATLSCGWVRDWVCCEIALSKSISPS